VTRVKGSLLLITGAVLLVLTVLLLASLWGGEAPVREPEPDPVASAVVERGTPPPRKPPHLRRVLPAASADAGAPPAAAAPLEAGAAPKYPVVQRIAPAWPPAGIDKETDPKKRAELMKMHELATSRVRANQLQRRAQALEQALERAKRDRTWTEKQIQERQQDLKEVREAVQEAEGKVETLSKELGVRR
jgi:hypothetical protein